MIRYISVSWLSTFPHMPGGIRSSLTTAKILLSEFRISHIISESRSSLSPSGKKQRFHPCETLTRKFAFCRESWLEWMWSGLKDFDRIIRKFVYKRPTFRQRRQAVLGMLLVQLKAWSRGPSRRWSREFDRTASYREDTLDSFHSKGGAILEPVGIGYAKPLYLRAEPIIIRPSETPGAHTHEGSSRPICCGILSKPW